MRRPPEATPRMRPEERPRKLTRRSSSPSGKVFKMMASVSRAGMRCRRAEVSGRETDGDESHAKSRANAEHKYLPHAWRHGNAEAGRSGGKCRHADILVWAVQWCSEERGERITTEGTEEPQRERRFECQEVVVAR